MTDDNIKNIKTTNPLFDRVVAVRPTVEDKNLISLKAIEISKDKFI